MNFPFVNYTPYIFIILLVIVGILLFNKTWHIRNKYDRSILNELTNKIDLKSLKRITKDPSIDSKEREEIRKAYLYSRLIILFVLLFFLSAILITLI